MKVNRAVIGKCAEVVWSDPGSFKVRLADLPKGRAALATWTEYGVIHDVTDGVVIIAHSLGKDAQATADDEIHCSAVPEALIERIAIYSREAGANEPA